MKKRAFCALIASVVMILSGGCKTPEERSEIEADNLAWAERLADKYFDDAFEYDFHSYGGSGEGDPAVYYYVYTDGTTKNCISIPAKENAPDPYIYYDCTLHQYSSGYWSFEGSKDSERVEE